MKTKIYKEKYSKKTSKKKIKEKRYVDIKWILIISLVSFLISFFFSLFSEIIIPNATLVLSIFSLFVFIFLGILFDMIGISVTVADKKTFNSMASKQVRGANLAVSFIRNSEKVSSFCNDVIGDICGIISGGAGVSIAHSISNTFEIPFLYCTLLITSIIASLTISGKAIGKSFAINKSNVILYRFVSIIFLFYRKK